MVLSSDDESSLHCLSELQVEDSRLSQPSTDIDDLLSCPESSCMEDWIEGDKGNLGNNLENNVEDQSQLEPGVKEYVETDKILFSNIVHVINEHILCCPQVEDPMLSQSTTSVDDLLSCPENSCKKDWREENGRCLGSNLEMNVEDQSTIKIGETEDKMTDTFQSSDIALINEFDVVCMQDLNVKEIVIECTDSQYLDQDFSSQLSDSVSEVNPRSPINQSEISVCGSTECTMPKTISMLELLVLNTTESYKKNNIRKKLAPIWRIITDHRYAGPFLKPLKEREAPGYKEIVKRPMDLSTIKKGLSKGRIRTSVEFQRDVLLMLQNAVMYNSAHHSVHQKALEIQKDVQDLLQVLNEQVKQSATE